MSRLRCTLNGLPSAVYPLRRYSRSPLGAPQLCGLGLGGVLSLIYKYIIAHNEMNVKRIKWTFRLCLRRVFGGSAVDVALPGVAAQHRRPAALALA